LALARGENLVTFREILAKYGTAEPADREREGARFLALVGRVGDRFARSEGPRREDFDACLFMHLMDAVKPGSSEAWSGWFRTQTRHALSTEAS
jgi:hypothetical protein